VATKSTATLLALFACVGMELQARADGTPVESVAPDDIADLARVFGVKEVPA
jgi:hypothetical protein